MSGHEYREADDSDFSDNDEESLIKKIIWVEYFFSVHI